jgi:hypothetical protein
LPLYVAAGTRTGAKGLRLRTCRQQLLSVDLTDDGCEPEDRVGTTLVANRDRRELRPSYASANSRRLQGRGAQVRQEVRRTRLYASRGTRKLAPE